MNLRGAHTVYGDSVLLSLDPRHQSRVALLESRRALNLDLWTGQPLPGRCDLMEKRRALVAALRQVSNAGFSGPQLARLLGLNKHQLLEVLASPEFVRQRRRGPRGGQPRNYYVLAPAFLNPEEIAS